MELSRDPSLIRTLLPLLFVAAMVSMLFIAHYLGQIAAHLKRLVELQQRDQRPPADSEDTSTTL